MPLRQCDLEWGSPITPSVPPTSVGTSPKYNPCRRFRKGDEVEYLPKDGRELFEAKRLLAQRLTVVENEHKEYNRVAVKAQNGDVLSVPFYYLKLITPVEDMEPYFIGESENSYDLFRKTRNGNQLRASFWWKHNPTPDLIELSDANAKSAAEAECARLNAEYRKEHS